MDSTTTREKAVGAPHAHGSREIASTTTGESYCPPERRQTQRLAILERLLERGSVSTREARLELGIMSPAARVLELKRQQGLAIISRRDPQQQCARYHLLGEQAEASRGQA